MEPMSGTEKLSDVDNKQIGRRAPRQTPRKKERNWAFTLLIVRKDVEDGEDKEDSEEGTYYRRQYRTDQKDVEAHDERGV